MNKLLLALSSLMLVACAGPKGDSIVGPRGRRGAPGTPGTSCTVQQLTGAALVTCPDGTSAIVADGSDGVDGLNSTPVSVVQLCEGETTYPSTFVEVALKIGNKLYAVYSTHGGFLTELVPGDYRSNAVGSKCDFRVNEDLTVSN